MSKQQKQIAFVNSDKPVSVYALRDESEFEMVAFNLIFRSESYGLLRLVLLRCVFSLKEVSTEYI